MDTSPDAAPETIDVARPDQKNDLMEMLGRAAAASGRTPLDLALGFVSANIGPGKLSFDEYNILALYDEARYAGADLKSFVGLRVMRDIWNRINFRQDMNGLVSNKIAMTALVEAHGLPVIPVIAVYSASGGNVSSGALHDRAALVEFLQNADHFPLFGKPVEGSQSLGSAAFVRYDPSAGMLVGLGGSPVPLDDYVTRIVSHYGDGYLFQPHTVPHADTRAICGDRLATVRVLTFFTNGAAKIFRACEKIPAGTNVADNFWRSGNLLVELDLASGARKSAISGSGQAIRNHTHHPDSGAPIVGTTVPNWQEVCETAREGAKIVKETALIGWDIAATDDGAVIVEANDTPDLMLPQLADRKGVLDAELRAFIAERRQMKRMWKQDMRRELRESYRATFLN